MIIDSPRQLLAAIPHLIGFHPDQSLVLVLLQDQQVRAIVRLDSQDVGQLTELPAPLNQQTSTDNSDQGFVAVAYVEDLEAAQATTEHLEKLARQAGLPILDLLLVKNNAWRSLMCTDLDCCPEEGHSLSNSVPDIDAQFVFAGSAPFESREHMEESLTSRHLGDLEAQRDEAFAHIAEPAKSTPTEMSDAVITIFDRMSDLRQFTFHEMADLVRLLSAVRSRDAFLRKLFDNPDSRAQVRAHLVTVISTIPTNHIPPVATVLAGCAWLDGNGALARVALDRALNIDETYSLARLLDMALSHGVPPHVWSDSLQAVSYEQCLQGAA